MCRGEESNLLMPEALQSSVPIRLAHYPRQLPVCFGPSFQAFYEPFTAPHWRFLYIIIVAGTGRVSNPVPKPHGYLRRAPFPPFGFIYRHTRIALRVPIYVVCVFGFF